MNGYAALAAAFMLMLKAAAAAEDGSGAARELALKTAALAGKGESVSVTWRNLSSLDSSESAKARAAFEAALRQGGARMADGAAVEARLTFSESSTQFLLVAEVRKGEDRQVWISSWKRPAFTASRAMPATLERRLLWEGGERILDAAFPPGFMLLLTPSAVKVLQGAESRWTETSSIRLTQTGIRSRDIRGRLRVTGSTFQALLPGVVCAGSWQQNAAVECAASDQPWLIESGSRGMLLANPAPARNYFDGRVTTQAGERKTTPPFYTAASIDENGKTIWLLAALDGRVRLFDSNLAPMAGEIAGWGSDIAGTDARCGSGFQVLATQPGEAVDADAVQAFAISSRGATPMTAPVEFQGPVTALWSIGNGSVLAISHNADTGKYAAYTLTVSCAH